MGYKTPVPCLKARVNSLIGLIGQHCLLSQAEGRVPRTQPSSCLCLLCPPSPTSLPRGYSGCIRSSNIDSRNLTRGSIYLEGRRLFIPYDLLVAHLLLHLLLLRRACFDHVPSGDEPQCVLAASDTHSFPVSGLRM